MSDEDYLKQVYKAPPKEVADKEYVRVNVAVNRVMKLVIDGQTYRWVPFHAG